LFSSLILSFVGIITSCGIRLDPWLFYECHCSLMNNNMPQHCFPHGSAFTLVDVVVVVVVVVVAIVVPDSTATTMTTLSIYIILTLSQRILIFSDKFTHHDSGNITLSMA